MIFATALFLLGLAASRLSGGRRLGGPGPGPRFIGPLRPRNVVPPTVQDEGIDTPDRRTADGQSSHEGFHSFNPFESAEEERERVREFNRQRREESEAAGEQSETEDDILNSDLPPGERDRQPAGETNPADAPPAVSDTDPVADSPVDTDQTPTTSTPATSAPDRDQGFQSGNPFEGAAEERARVREFNRQREIASFGGGPGETRAEIVAEVEAHNADPGSTSAVDLGDLNRRIRLFNASQELHGQQVTELNVASAAAGTGLDPVHQAEIVDDLRSGDPDRVQAGQDQLSDAQTLAHGERVAAHSQTAFDQGVDALADTDTPTNIQRQLAGDLSSSNPDVRQAALDQINNIRTLDYGSRVAAADQEFHDVQTTWARDTLTKLPLPASESARLRQMLSGSETDRQAALAELERLAAPYLVTEDRPADIDGAGVPSETPSERPVELDPETGEPLSDSRQRLGRDAQHTIPLDEETGQLALDKRPESGAGTIPINEETGAPDVTRVPGVREGLLTITDPALEGLTPEQQQYLREQARKGAHITNTGHQSFTEYQPYTPPSPEAERALFQQGIIPPGAHPYTEGLGGEQGGYKVVTGPADPTFALVEKNLRAMGVIPGGMELASYDPATGRAQVRYKAGASGRGAEARDILYDIYVPDAKHIAGKISEYSSGYPHDDYVEGQDHLAFGGFAATSGVATGAYSGRGGLGRIGKAGLGAIAAYGVVKGVAETAKGLPTREGSVVIPRVVEPETAGDPYSYSDYAFAASQREKALPGFDATAKAGTLPGFDATAKAGTLPGFDATAKAGALPGFDASSGISDTSPKGFNEGAGPNTGVLLQNAVKEQTASYDNARESLSRDGVQVSSVPGLLDDVERMLRESPGDRGMEAGGIVGGETVGDAPGGDQDFGAAGRAGDAWMGVRSTDAVVEGAGALTPAQIDSGVLDPAIEAWARAQGITLSNSSRRAILDAMRKRALLQQAWETQISSGGAAQSPQTGSAAAPATATDAVVDAVDDGSFGYGHGRDPSTGTETATAPATDVRVDTPPAISTPIDAPPAIHTQVETPPVIQTQVETPPAVQTQIDTLPAIQTQVVTQPTTQTQVDTPPTTQTQVVTPPTIQTEVDTLPTTQTRVDTPAATQTRVDARTDVQTQVDTPAAIQTQVDTPTATQTQVDPSTATQTQVDTPPAVQTQIDTPPAVETQVETPPAIQTQIDTPPAIRTDVTDFPGIRTQTQTRVREGERTDIRARPLRPPRPDVPDGEVLESPEAAPRPPGSYPRRVAHREEVEYTYDRTTGEFGARVVASSQPTVVGWDQTPPEREQRAVGEAWHITPTANGVDAARSQAGIEVPRHIQRQLRERADRLGEDATTIADTREYTHDLDSRETTHELVRDRPTATARPQAQARTSESPRDRLPDDYRLYLQSLDKQQKASRESKVRRRGSPRRGEERRGFVLPQVSITEGPAPGQRLGGL